jgi:type IV pilus assembly protein PilB
MDTRTFSSKFSEILLKHNALDPNVLSSAQEETQGTGVRLEKYLVENRLVSGPLMTLALAEYLGMAPISLARFTPDSQLLENIPRDLMTKHLLLPLTQTGKTLTVAFGDPFDIMAIEELRAITGMEITPLVAGEKEIQDLLARLLVDKDSGLDMEDIMKSADGGDVEVGPQEKEDINLEEMLQSAEGAPVIRMVNLVLVEALRLRASDIHLEPQEKQFRLRYRIDGNLVEKPGPPKSYQNAVISRVKIMADLNIAERRVPQDGRFKIRALGKEVDIRVSVLPTVHGEKVVMRTLDKSTLAPNLSALGLDEAAYNAMAYAIAQPHGIILVTGPTGSGKTTTLYSCLQELNKVDVNIVTCEDPVEYQLVGINQVQVKPDVGLTFAAALRSILRQDPDIVLVGEIRDSETAEIAVKAALTGHLVLSTLHTNDAAGAITRLIDMGIEPFLLASSIILAQAQRLYRKLCAACKKEDALPLEVLKANRIDPEFFAGAHIYKAVGCPKCNHTGYKGRGAIMEVLPVDDEIREFVLRNASSSEIRDRARAKGMIVLKEVGLMKVREGITSLEAALEITGGE